MKKIGIIGGMGAAAGAHLYDLLIRESHKNGAEKDDDFPEVFLHNIPTKGLDQHGITDHAVIRRELVSSVEMMNRLGAQIIMIACNSAHVHLRYLQDKSSVQILDMVGITVENIGAATKVGVISSSTTKDSRLYEEALNARDIDVILTTEEQQQIIDALIEKAIRGRISDKHRQKLFYVVRSMFRRGADEVILGCTELPLIGNPFGLCIDAGEKMIERAVTL